MKDTAITVSEAARNFADCLNRVHYQNKSFVVLKNGKPFARIVPEAKKVCTGKDLAEALDQTALSPEAARAWRRDLVSARNALTFPADKWR